MLSGKIIGTVIVGWNSIVASVVCLRIWKPEWFAYPSVTLYATTITNNKDTSKNDVGNNIGNKNTTCRVDDLKEMACEINISTEDVKKNTTYINATNIDRDFDFYNDVSSTKFEKDKYYKIEVSKKLVLNLIDKKSNKIKVKSNNQDASIELTALFAWEEYNIYFFKEPEILKFWIGVLEEATQTSTSKIMPNGSKYSCKIGDKVKECEIYDIKSGTDIKSLDSITDYKHNMKATEAKKGNFYLIKVDGYGEFSEIEILVKSESDALKMNAKQVIVVDVEGTNKLFQIT